MPPDSMIYHGVLPDLKGVKWSERLQLIRGSRGQSSRTGFHGP